jgi:ubiquinone/menaquinone biosynthesis C-methylase UbiE
VDGNRFNLREAFNRHALRYDERFSSLKTTQAIRQEIWQVADRLFPAGSRILDLGCGTGEDAIHFARQGTRVTAIDLAPGMIAQLRTKAEALGLSGLIEARVSDIETFEAEAGAFDGAFSNFGAMNCVRSLATFRDVVARALKPGAPLVVVAMGRLYPLETAVYLLKGNLRRAFARLKPQPELTLEGIRISFWYHSPRNLRGALGERFSQEQVLGLRSFAPSSSLEHVERFLPAGLIRTLDRFVTSFRPTAGLADHYLTVWRKLPSHSDED